MTTVSEFKKNLTTIMHRPGETKLLTADEFAQMYGYAPSGIRVLLQRGKITGAFKVGKEWFIPEDANVIVRQNKKKRSAKLIGVDGFCT